jgi:hypothetical protein
MIAQKILELSEDSSDRLVTYLELWQAFRLGEVWDLPSLKITSQWLSEAIRYCAERSSPIVTALVVQTSDRKLSEEAILAIFNESKALGVRVGLVPKAFAEGQQRRAK